MTYRKGCTAILFAALLANRGAGQTRIDRRTQTRNADFSAQPTTPSATGTVLPATCTVGQTYFKTDAAAGKNWYGCTAPDTWTPQAGAEPAPNYAVPLSAQTVVTVPGSMHKFGPPTWWRNVTTTPLHRRAWSPTRFWWMGPVTMSRSTSARRKPAIAC